MPMLPRKALLPAEHVVDTGYVDAKLLVESQQNYQVEPSGTNPQELAMASHSSLLASMPVTFPSIGNSNRPACPEGHTSIRWTPAIDHRKNEGDLDQVLNKRLPGVSVSLVLHPVDSPHSSHSHDPST
jgi:hypothetical protein